MWKYTTYVLCKSGLLVGAGMLDVGWIQMRLLEIEQFDWSVLRQRRSLLPPFSFWLRYRNDFRLLLLLVKYNTVRRNSYENISSANFHSSHFKIDSSRPVPSARSVVKQSGFVDLSLLSFVEIGHQGHQSFHSKP